MLRAGEEVDAHVVGQRQVPRAVRRGVDERGRAAAAPVLDAGVRVEDLRLVIARARVVERAFLDAGHRIALLGVGERETTSR